jgi:putative two-component system response regulator
MSLYFRCRSCGDEHPAPLVFSSQALFERAHLASNSFQCEVSRNFARYRKSDLYWKADTDLYPLALPAENNLSVLDTDLSRARILVVDDDPQLLAILEHLLKRAGYRHIAVTPDSAGCVEMVESFRPDLLLLDLEMPKLDGYAVLERLRAQVSADDYLPVLVLTGDLEPAARHRALSGGAKDFLNKPFDQIEALLRIRNLLETRFLHLRLRRYAAALEERLQVRRTG